jgi:hypothetical protein
MIGPSPRERGAQPNVEDAQLALEPRRGIPTEATLFLGIAVFSFVLGAIYAYTTWRSGEIEWAGVAALAAGGAFAGFFGVFLLLSLRRIQDDFEALEDAHAEGDEIADDVLFLPTQSIWPIGLGLGATLIGAGVPLGFWVLIPGLAVFGYSLIGFAHQSRVRE